MITSGTTWLDIRTGLGVTSIIVGSIAATLPEPYSKYAFAVALALSNAAIYIKTETKTQAKTLPEPAFQSLFFSYPR